MASREKADVHYKSHEAPFTGAPGLDFGDNHYFVFDRKKPDDAGRNLTYRKYGTKEYGQGHNMSHHGEGKPYGEK